MEKGKGYKLRVQRDGSDWRNEKGLLWGVNGELPDAWQDIKSGEDPSVVSASLHPNTRYRRLKPAIDEYNRSA